ncbi:MAG: hypothetical protein HQL26_09640 [Candidatus Omnitrophica bacterium]|nr:hypothetical protein [Candidatus Omnitrophota bacterium]
MKILIAAVAEHAWVENGCLSLCRTFDTINAPQFPYQMPRLSIALRLLFERAEGGAHKLILSLSDADGKKLLNVDLNIPVNALNESSSKPSFSFALNGQSVVFPKEGEYVVDIVVDGRVEASVPIYARKSTKDLPSKK